MSLQRSSRSSFRWFGDSAVCLWVMLLVMAAWFLTPAGAYLHQEMEDGLLYYTLPQLQPAADIVVVEIDKPTIKALGEWPWSAATHAQVIQRLSQQAGDALSIYLPAVAPSVVQEDAALENIRQAKRGVLTIPSESVSQELLLTLAQAEENLSGATQLATGLRQSGRIALSYNIKSMTDMGVGWDRAPSYIPRATLSQRPHQLAQVVSTGYPDATIARSAPFIGYTDWSIENYGAIRSASLIANQAGEGVLSLALLTVANGLNLEQSQITPFLDQRNPAILMGRLQIPINSDGSVGLRWYGSPSGATPFKKVSLIDVLTQKNDPALWKQKTLVIDLATDLDIRSLISAKGDRLSQAEVFATVVSNLRQRHAITKPSWSPQLTWLAAFLTLAFAAFWCVRLPLSVALIALASWGLVLFVLQWGLLYQFYSVSLGGALWMTLASAGALVAVRFHSVGSFNTNTASAQTDYTMGLALQEQGQLDMAFERFRRIPPTQDVLNAMYRLAGDFEDARQFAKAKSAYKCILQSDRQFKDAKIRYQVCKVQANTTNPQPVEVLQTVDTQFMDSKAVAVDLGRYVLGREIGHGSMGVVYQGHDPETNQSVAIKTLALSQEFEGDSLAEAQARFFREAETAGRLRHPHIVAVYDSGQAHDLAYIAMEFVTGHDLSRHSTQGDLLEVDQVIQIASKVASALDYAHAQNVVHRDIKPSNIMFDADKQIVKVMDFGIARITDASKTRTGLVMGTPSFMSPEQLAGGKVDGRSDIYSLGATVFQLLTGSAPLMGATMTDLMIKIATEPAPDIRILRPELSADLAKIVAQALQKKPEHRFQTGQQFADALGALLSSGALEKASPQDQGVVYDGGLETLQNTPDIVLDADDLSATNKSTASNIEEPRAV